MNFDEVIDRLKEIYEFLGVDPAFVPASAGIKTNASFRPRSKYVHQLYGRFSRSRIRMTFEAMFPHTLRPKARNIIRTILGTQRNMPPMSPVTRDCLDSYFAPRVARLESMLGRDLDIWRSASCKSVLDAPLTHRRHTGLRPRLCPSEGFPSYDEACLEMRRHILLKGNETYAMDYCPRRHEVPSGTKVP